MGITVKVTDNSDLFLDALKERKAAALFAIGLAAEANAKQEITQAIYNKPPSPNYVRTGRLRNSITFATSEKHSTGKPPATPEDYTPHGQAEEDAVYIGTNVEYAAPVELGSSKRKGRPFLKPAVTEKEYVDQYKRLAEDALKGT